MQIAFAKDRMSAALDHLSDLAGLSLPRTPMIIFLQEMTHSDLQQIKDTPWVQERFLVTDLDVRNWTGSYYGTTTLVDNRLAIESVFRVPWISGMDRDGLFVDISLTGEGELLRLCNVHLESLVADPPVRPSQLQAAAFYLHDPAVVSGILAGDLNAIQPFDRTLHSDNDLRDVYLELGGQEDSDDGYTWGYQVPQSVRDRFGCCRMDKILIAGALIPKQFQRIGVGVKVDDETKEALRQFGQEEWVTDHYGVMGDFELERGGWTFL